MSDQKPSKKSVAKASKVQEADPVLPSLEEIAEALKGESLEMVDWSPEDKAKMLESYQTKGAPDPVGKESCAGVLGWRGPVHVWRGQEGHARNPGTCALPIGL